MFSIISKEGVEEGVVLVEVLELAEVDVPDSGGGLRLAVLITGLALGRLALGLLRLGCVWGWFRGWLRDPGE